MEKSTIKSILEAAIFAASDPLTIDKLLSLFPENAKPSKALIHESLEALQQDYESRGVELVKVASGYRFQAKSCFSEWLQRLWQQRPPKYSRALFETLALIAYKQPLTRGEIEEVRGVAVSSHIVKTLIDREWVKVVGHREVPGKPALLATTKQFLDYFNLSSLSSLPPLEELMDLDEVGKQLGLEAVAGEGSENSAHKSSDETSEVILEQDNVESSADSGSGLACSDDSHADQTPSAHAIKEEAHQLIDTDRSCSVGVAAGSVAENVIEDQDPLTKPDRSVVEEIA